MYVCVHQSPIFDSSQLTFEEFEHGVGNAPGEKGSGVVEVDAAKEFLEGAVALAPDDGEGLTHGDKLRAQRAHHARLDHVEGVEDGRDGRAQHRPAQEVGREAAHRR